MENAAMPRDFHFYTVPTPAPAPLIGVRLRWTWERVSFAGTARANATFNNFAAAVEDATAHGFDEQALPGGRTALDLVCYGPTATIPYA